MTIVVIVEVVWVSLRHDSLDFRHRYHRHEPKKQKEGDSYFVTVKNFGVI